jgi:hypothetical protein
MIAKGENLGEAERRILLSAAILHDIGIREAERKYGCADGRYQETEGPAVARGLLEGLALKKQDQERVLFLVGNHHSYSKIDAPDFQILVEADFLVNIYEDGMKKEAVQSVKEHIFKTRTGSRLLEALYL